MDASGCDYTVLSLNSSPRLPDARVQAYGVSPLTGRRASMRQRAFASTYRFPEGEGVPGDSMMALLRNDALTSPSPQPSPSKGERETPYLLQSAPLKGERGKAQEKSLPYLTTYQLLVPPLTKGG